MRTIFLAIFFIFNHLIFSQSVVKTINFSGLESTKQSYVEQFIEMKKGDTINTISIEQDINFLKNLPAFSNVSYNIKNKNNHAYINYSFEEAYTLLPEFNFWSADDQTTYRLGFNEYNLLGRGIQLSLAYQNSGKSSFFASTKIPYLVNNFGIYLGFVSWTTDEPFYHHGTSFNYEYKNTSYELLALYDPDFHHHFELGFNYFNEKYSANSNVGLTLPQNLTQDKFSVKFNYRINKSKVHFFYIDGFVNNLYSQYVKTKDVSNLFLIFLNDFLYFKRIGNYGNFATRIRLGLGSNEVSPFSPFVLDNHVVIRGVGDRIDRGSGVIVLNTEYRQTAWENNWGAVQGVIFSDLGSWRSPGGSFGDFIKKESVHWHLGGGVRLIYKKAFNTILRIDYGVGIGFNKGNGIVIGFGQYF